VNKESSWRGEKARGAIDSICVETAVQKEGGEDKKKTSGTNPGMFSRLAPREKGGKGGAT